MLFYEDKCFFTTKWEFMTNQKSVAISRNFVIKCECDNNRMDVNMDESVT